MPTFLQPVEVTEMSPGSGYGTATQGGTRIASGRMMGLLMFAQFSALATHIASVSAELEKTSKDAVALLVEAPVSSGAQRDVRPMDEWTDDAAANAVTVADATALDSTSAATLAKSSRLCFNRIGRILGAQHRVVADTLLGMRAIVALMANQKLWEALGVDLGDGGLAILALAGQSGGGLLSAAVPPRV